MISGVMAHASGRSILKKDSSGVPFVNPVFPGINKHPVMHAASDCGLINWTTWGNFTGRSATGTIDNGGDNVTVTMTANYNFDSTPEIYAYGAFSGYQPPIPNETVPRTTWSNTTNGTTTICFSKTVKNPVLLLSSLGATSGISVKLTFSAPYVQVKNISGMVYNDSYSLTGTEGYAIIMFPGDYDCINISSSTQENYTNLTWGLKPQPFPVNITQTENVCGGVTLQADGGVTYHWNGGDSPDQAINTFHASGTYIVTVTDANGCTSSASQQVTVVGQQEHPEITVVSSTCGSTTVKASDGGTNYQWNGNGDTPNSATNTYHVSGSYAVLITYPPGCRTPAFGEVTVVVAPVTTIAKSADVCGSVTLTASSGGTSYQWDGGDTPTAATNTFHSSGTYHVSVLYPNNNCPSVAQQDVVVRNAPATSIAIVSNSCGTEILKASDGGTSYQWDGGDTPTQATNTFHTNGTYHVTVMYPGNSCPSVQSQDVVINQPPTVNVDEVSNVCGSVTLKASDGGASYQWDGGDTPDQATNTFHTSGTYHLTVIYPDLCHVPVTRDVTVNQNATAGISISILSTEICQGSIASFTANISPGTADQSLAWFKNGQPTGATSITYSPDDLVDGDQISCVLTSTNVCTTPALVTSNVITMKVDPLPEINIASEVTITAGHGVMMEPIVTGNIKSALWTPSTGLDYPTSENPTVNPSSTTTYQLTVTSVNDCTATATIKVNVLDAVISPPNTFTPNGDGINDLWDITNIDTYPNCTVDIYSRYGSHIFYSKGYARPWDGTYAGRQVPVGVYYYVINLNNKKKTRVTGYVTVIR